MLIRQAGLSLIELLVAIGLFSILAATAASVVAGSYLSTRQAEEYIAATTLAQEGIEAATSIRNQNWSDVAAGTYGVSNSGGAWEWSGSSDVVDKYTRQVSVAEPDGNTRSITSSVTWDVTPSRQNTVTLDTTLTRWELVLGSGSGGGTPPPVVVDCPTYCQSQSYDSGICRGNTNQCNQQGETRETGGDQYCTGGAQADSCCCIPIPLNYTTCSDFCAGTGFSGGICRQNVNRCNQNGESAQALGNRFCTGGPSADTCCCDP